jgi:TRAP-type C4-dicarboxylate transport system permease small subunit
LAKLIRFEQSIIVLFILGAAFIGIIQIILRYLFGLGFVWSDGIVIMLTIGGSLTASATVIEKKGHIAIDILVQKLPQHMQRFMQIVANLLTTIFLLILCLLSFSHIKFLYNFGGESLITYLPAWVEFSVLPATLTLMVIHSALHVIRSFKGDQIL